MMIKKKKTVGYRLSFVDSCRLMPGKLSDLVDNLSGIHDKECKRCMERKCEFIGFKNNRLFMQRMQRNQILSYQMMQLKISQCCINFATVTLINVSCY